MCVCAHCRCSSLSTAENVFVYVDESRRINAFYYLFVVSSVNKIDVKTKTMREEVHHWSYQFSIRYEIHLTMLESRTFLFSGQNRLKQ
jgi:hypothetical protein